MTAATPSDAGQNLQAASPSLLGLENNAPGGHASEPSDLLLNLPPEVRLDALAVDAACSGNPGVMEYRGVMVDTGEEVFRQGPFAAATNNIGEFLAIVHALALVEQGKLTVAAIYSDSVTAQAWVRQRRCKSKLIQNAGNAPVFELINRANAWLATHAVSTNVLKWKTDVWGEIPADFGRK